MVKLPNLLPIESIIAANLVAIVAIAPKATAPNAIPLFIDQDAGSTAPGIRIDCDGNDGSNKVIGINIDVDNADAGDQIALDIDQVDESKSYFARFNATTAWTSSKDPETNAEAGWVKIMVGTTAYFIPYYAAS